MLDVSDLALWRRLLEDHHMNVDVAIVVLVAMICLSAFTVDDDEALFGLRWGMTPAQIKALGVTLAKTK